MNSKIGETDAGFAVYCAVLGNDDNAISVLVILTRQVNLDLTISVVTGRSGVSVHISNLAFSTMFPVIIVNLRGSSDFMLQNHSLF